MAGLTTAALLGRTGSHEVVVLEQAAGFGEAGYGIGLYPLGSAVFHALGTYDELLSRSTTFGTYEVHGPDGQVLQTVDLAALLAGFGPMLGVTRADIIDVLLSSVPPGAVRFGLHAVSVQALDGGVAVTTAQGEAVEGDVVVAADGMHSALRASIFGDVRLHDTGYDAWMWWAPPGAVSPDVVAEYWGPSAFVGLYPMKRGINVAVAVPRDLSPAPDGDPAAIIAALQSTVAEHAPAAGAIAGLWEAGGSKPFLWPMQDVRAPDITALDDRVALCGDSGIGFLPTAGVGASNALRSAAALAYDLSLADAASAPLAVARWRQRVRKLVDKNQEDSRELAKVMMVKHGATSAVVNAVMKHAPVTMMTSSIVKSMQVPF